jgi:hypothetical protein
MRLRRRATLGRHAQWRLALPANAAGIWRVRVSCSRLGTAHARFRVPSPPIPRSPLSGDPVIVAVGDIACDPLSWPFNNGKGNASSCHMKQVSALVAAIHPVVLLGLGDMQYEDGQYGKYVGGDVSSSANAQCPKGTTTCTVRGSYDASFGHFRAITFPTPGGGHDANGASGYYRYFGTNAGPWPTQTWYSFNLGGWHIVSLNANCTSVPGYRRSNQCAAGSAQERWLKSDLAASRKPCSIMFVHFPRWNAGQYPDNTSYQPLVNDFYEAGGELLLTGHDHDYQRYAPQDPAGRRDASRGITEFVVGTGGRNHTPASINTAHPNLLVSDDETYGVLRLVLHSAGYDFDFVPERGYTFSDSGRNIPCH